MKEKRLTMFEDDIKYIESVIPEVKLAFKYKLQKFLEIWKENNFFLMKTNKKVI